MGTQKGLIFGSCECSSWGFLEKLKGWSDVVIAADGGVQCAQKAGFLPDVYVGDGDSGGKASPGMEEVSLLPEKDLTDLQAAFEWARDHDVQKMVFTACTGGRQDHHLSALQLLETAKAKGINAVILDPDNRISFIDSESVLVQKSDYHYFSLIPVDKVLTGVTIVGAKYPLFEKTIYRGDSLTVSNEWAEDSVTITIGQGACYLVESN